MGQVGGLESPAACLIVRTSFAGQGQSSLEVVGTAAIMERGRSRARPKMKPKILPLDAKPRKNPKYDKIGPQVDTGYNARKQLER